MRLGDWHDRDRRRWHRRWHRRRRRHCWGRSGSLIVGGLALGRSTAAALAAAAPPLPLQLPSLLHHLQAVLYAGWWGY